MNEQTKKHVMDKLERKREVLNLRLDRERSRINERFDKKQAQLNGKLSSKQEQIITAALELLADSGLNDLSLRDIAKKINIKAPALYWYFKSKSELVDFMAEAILSRQLKDMKPRAADETWQVWLATYMGRLRKAMLVYPDGGRVVAGAHLYPTTTLAQIFEDTTVSLISADIDQQTAISTAMTAVHFTFGFVIEEQSGPSAEEFAAFQKSNALLAYPNFSNAIKHYSAGSNFEDKAYTSGLQLIIKGAETK